MIDLDFIERLIRTLDESGLDHVEIERGGTRLRVSKSPPVQAIEEAEPTHSTEPMGSEPPSDPSIEAQTEAPAASPSVDEDLVEITSPMVGTFYRSPSPGTDPFTDVGSRISAGDVLCIIEAMKLMNELEAEASGTIHQVCVGDGEPVEYGQVLFRLRP